MAWEPMGDGLPVEFLPACLLLLLVERPAHGYQLCADLVDLGMEVDSGTVYRRLRAMERDGVVTSQWELSDSGPPRRRYVATALGRRHLGHCDQSATTMVDLLVAYTRRCARLAAPDGQATSPGLSSGRGASSAPGRRPAG